MRILEHELRVAALAAEFAAPQPGHVLPGQGERDVRDRVDHGHLALQDRARGHRVLLHQPLGVGVAHAAEQRDGIGALHHPARVHDGDPVGVPGDDPHVVRDQQHGHAVPVLEVPGAILAVRALYELHRTGGKCALVTMCIGGGQGIAAILERV